MTESGADRSDQQLREKYARILEETKLKALKKDEKTYRDILCRNIIDKKFKDVKIQLDLLKEEDDRKMLLPCAGDKFNPLHQAAFGQEDDMGAEKGDGDTGSSEMLELLFQMVKLCPEAVWVKRSGAYKGQTILHILVMKQYNTAVRRLLEALREIIDNNTQDVQLPNIAKLLNGNATGARFEKTVMMGGYPLFVAALTFNPDMVKLLIEHKADPKKTNSKGDTVFHTLVRYAVLYPNKLKQVINMMRELNNILPAGEHKLSLVELRELWLVENNRGFTALRLAAGHAQQELFHFIFSLPGIYCHQEDSDGLFDFKRYDITEIDPWALHEARSAKSGGKSREKVLKFAAKKDARVHYEQAGQKERVVSVLEIICETAEGDELFDVLSTGVVQEIIKLKWKRYRSLFWMWAVLHVFFMFMLTAHGVYKAGLIKYNLLSRPPNKIEEAFVIAVASITLPVPVVTITMELILKFRRRQPWKLKLHHHNGLYRLMLLVFSLSVFVDSIWYLAAGPSNNYFLILALLTGWWFTTFFLRPFLKFSYFTVMLQKILFGDLLRFFVVIFIEWMAFTVTMHMVFLATPDDSRPEGFENLWKSMLTMFQLMLGMKEIDVLNGSRNEWIAIILFLLYIILTYVLLLNALIAMMSSTCAVIAEGRENHWHLQRLSVVLLLENMIPFDWMACRCGQDDRVYERDLKSQDKARFYFKMTSAVTDQTRSREPGDGYGDAFPGRKIMNRVCPGREAHVGNEDPASADTKKGLRRKKKNKKDKHLSRSITMHVSIDHMKEGDLLQDHSARSFAVTPRAQRE